jgi:HAD superfamily hydrolase (TIGR01509 family)
MVDAVRAVLCDIDGTLLDSNWLHASAWKDAFAVIDIQLSLEDVRRQIGKGGNEIIPVFVPWWKRKAVEQPLKKYREYIFRADYLAQVRPFPRVRELLQRIRASEIKVGLASSAHQQDLEDYKQIAQIDDLVDVSISSESVSRSKPHPDIFEAALEKLGVKARNALALGDTPYDAEAAGKADVWTIGVTSGGWTEKDLLAAGCIEVYKDAADLLSNFERSALAK